MDTHRPPRSPSVKRTPRGDDAARGDLHTDWEVPASFEVAAWVLLGRPSPDGTPIERRSAADGRHRALLTLQRMDDDPSSTAEQEQFFVFDDVRSGSGTLRLPASGFKIGFVGLIEDAEGGGAKRRFIVVTKSPKADNAVNAGQVDALPHKAEVK